MNPATVVHCKRDLGSFDLANYVYVGRPSQFGNPFSHKEGTIAQYKVASLEEALKKFEEHFMASPRLHEAARKELTGKVLGCWCRPKGGFKGKYLCHAQFLAAWLNGCKPEEIG